MTLPLAHALSGRADLPLPEWLFGLVAAIVLAVSFVALALLWRRPKLEGGPARPIPSWISSIVTSRAVAVLCGGIGVFLLGVTVWSGLTGTQIASRNFSPTFVFIVFWVGMVPASLLLGDVFRAFNPWRAIGRSFGWACTRVLGADALEALPYPRWLGHIPAAAGLVAFAWLELVAFDGERPRNVAVAALAYSCWTFLGMGMFGVETWISRAESFSVYFGLIARISPFAREDDRIVLRNPLAGLTRFVPLSGTVLLLAVVIGTVTFDGMQEGSFYSGIASDMDTALDGVLGATGARMLTDSIGLGVVIALIWGFYRLGCQGVALLVRDERGRDVAPAFVHTLVPIGVAYVGAHYVSLLLLEGQGIASLVSDPLGEGWDLFGTRELGIDFGLVGATIVWYMQVAFVVAGHVSGLVLAHDRALVRYGDPRDAARSQIVMLTVMVGLTCLALWLLASANA